MLQMSIQPRSAYFCYRVMRLSSALQYSSVFLTSLQPCLTTNSMYYHAALASSLTVTVDSTSKITTAIRTSPFCSAQVQWLSQRRSIVTARDFLPYIFLRSTSIQAHFEIGRGSRKQSPGLQSLASSNSTAMESPQHRRSGKLPQSVNPCLLVAKRRIHNQQST